MKTSSHGLRRIVVKVAVILATVIFLATMAATAATGIDLNELAPSQLVQIGKRQLGRYSDRTVSASLLVSRDSAQLLGFTLKPRPYQRAIGVPDARTSEQGKPAQVEVRLLGPNGAHYTQRVEVKGICLDHPFGTESHIEGDTTLFHGDSVLVELPELPGYDHVEVAFYRNGAQGVERRQVASAKLDSPRFASTDQSFHYSDVAFADRSVSPLLEGSAVTTGEVYWPELFGDSDLTRIGGDPNQVEKRINVVIVPDGYTYAEKAQMITDADAMVREFRADPTFQRYDAFFNYILVHAYSKDSGTDECDCDVIKDTAMGTGFPHNGDTSCGDAANRCLSYFGSCDTQTIDNMAAAELRAPACDTTIVMVNTARSGGCASGRAFYNAANTAIAVHELGHTFGGLADEYVENGGCGTVAWEVNTSKNDTTGAWPEWIDDLGAPREGAQYYTLCLYRPADDCRMRHNGSPFCPVCNQHLALCIFEHPRIDPTAPIESVIPQSPLTVGMYDRPLFWPRCRMPSAPYCVTWSVQAAGDPFPTVIPCPIASLAYGFDAQGTYTVTFEIVADCEGIKPSMTGPNRDTVTWEVIVTKADAIVGIDSPIRIFDGTPQSVNVTTYPPGLLVHVTYDGSPDPPSAIGTYHVVAVVDDANYRGGMSSELRIVPGVSVSDATVVEGQSGASHALFPVTLGGASPEVVSVKFTTTDGTATVADQDYVETSGVVEFAPGETEKVIDVTINADTKVEADETFSVTLSIPLHTAIVNGTATGTILNDDHGCVVARHIFYNNSAWDGDDPGADPRDDDAIATDKVALLPGGTASFANYTSYGRGINGIMVDIQDLVGEPSAADFEFRVGNSDNVAAWELAPAPADIVVRRGAGTAGSDRVTLVWWPENSIQQQWLQVRMKANTITALLADDVFYFGNAIGETGNSATDAQVNSTDVNCARMNPHFTVNPAPIDDICDFNRDKLVNSTDVNLARMHTTFSVNALKLIKP